MLLLLFLLYIYCFKYYTPLHSNKICKNIFIIGYCFYLIVFLPIILSPIYFFKPKKSISVFISESAIYLLGVKYHYLKKNSYPSKNIVILRNHRTFFDAIEHISIYPNASGIGKYQTVYFALVWGLFGYLEEKIVMVNKSKNKTDSRASMFDKIKYHLKIKNVVLYPEGTRLRHIKLTSIEEAQKTLKPGLLKSLYENEISIVISIPMIN